MADVVTELRRPSTLGAVVFAVIGWVLLIWSFAQSSSDQDALRSQLSDAQRHSAQLTDELKQERDAAGALSDMTRKRDAADADAKRAQAAAQDAAKVRDDAQAQVITARSALKASGDQQADLDRGLKDATARRDKVLGDLETARQQSETVKQAFAQASEQLAAKNSELAGLNDKLQKAQAATSQQAATQAESDKRLAGAQAAIKDLIAQQADLDKALASAKAAQAKAQGDDDVLQSRLAEGRRSLDGLNSQIEAAKAELATVQAAITEAQKPPAAPAATP